MENFPMVAKTFFGFEEILEKYQFHISAYPFVLIKD